MRHTFGLTFLLAACLLTSCATTDDILYRGKMFGFMQEAGVFLGDDNITYVFSNVEASDKVPAEGRMLAVFDVYSQLDNDGKRFSAKILDFAVPVYKEPVFCEDEEEELALGADPILMSDGSYSGGCLNMICTAKFNNDSGITHSIDLQTSSPEPVSDTLHLVLRHNAKGDVPETHDDFSFTEYSFYASFPIKNLLGDKTVVEIRWFWEDEWHNVFTTLSK